MPPSEAPCEIRLPELLPACGCQELPGRGRDFVALLHAQLLAESRVSGALLCSGVWARMGCRKLQAAARVLQPFPCCNRGSTSKSGLGFRSQETPTKLRRDPESYARPAAAGSGSRPTAARRRPRRPWSLCRSTSRKRKGAGPHSHIQHNKKKAAKSLSALRGAI